MIIGKIEETPSQQQFGILSYDKENEIYFSGGFGLSKNDIVIFEIKKLVKSIKRAEKVTTYLDSIQLFGYYYKEIYFNKDLSDWNKEQFNYHFKALQLFEKKGLSTNNLKLNCIQKRYYKDYLQYKNNILA